MKFLIAVTSIVCLYISRKNIMSKFYAVRKYLYTLQTQKKLTIFYVDNEWYCDHIIHKYFMEHKVLGLDCEWVTIGSHQEPVSLLQMASPNGICGLFRMPKLYSTDYYHKIQVVSSLSDLLGRDDIIKVGVAIENDAKYLARDYNVRLSSWLDLRHIAKDNDVLPRGLKYLAQETVGIKLDKTFNVRVSDWDAEELSEEQIHYAAMDAHAAISIFTYFVALKQSVLRLLFPLSTNVYKQYFREQNIDAYLEVNYKDRQPPTQTKFLKNPLTQISSPNKFYSTYSRVPESTSGRKVFQKGKLYDNCYLLDTLDQVLCTCDRKKAQWYLDKDLAVLVREDPFTVRLLFQPEGFDREDCKYYSEEKRNQCVVCGTEDPHTLVKKYIVPHEYRRHLPEYMKDRRSHDVLLMCGRCHQKSNAQDQRLRHALASQCHAPFDSKTNKPVHTDFHIRKVKSAAQALLRHQKTGALPENRERELIEIVSEHYAGSEHAHWPFLKMVYQAAALCDTTANTDFVPHGLAVVHHFARRGQLLEFETRWRQHFLQTMQPRFLPPHWSLHHNHNQDRATKKSSTTARSNPNTSSSAISNPSTSSSAISNPSSPAESNPSFSLSARSNPSFSSSSRSNPSTSSTARSELNTSPKRNPKCTEEMTIFERFACGDKKPLPPGVLINQDWEDTMMYNMMAESHKLMNPQN